MRLLLLALVVAELALVAVSVSWFILYDDEPVATADAIVVLAGSKHRLPVGLELFRQKVAPTLVVSDGLDPRSPSTQRLCLDRRAVICPRPDPYSTRGEARMIARLARERGWSSVVVVSSRFHLYRAKLLIRRCYDGRLAMVGSRNTWYTLPLNIGTEWLKLGLAELRRGC